jgi:hypothetical protein
MARFTANSRFRLRRISIIRRNSAKEFPNKSLGGIGMLR